MKYAPVLLATILASSASIGAFAETNTAAPSNGPLPAMNGATPAGTAQQADANDSHPPSADPPTAPRAGDVTGSVLGVDPHARIITIRVDHSVDGIHTGNRIEVNKAPRSKVTRSRRKPIHRRRKPAPHAAVPRQQRMPAPSRPTGNSPVSSRASAPNTAAPNTGGNAAEENNGAGSTTLPPAAPSSAAPPVNSAPSETTSPNASNVPPELGLVPRRSGGYVPGGTTSGGF